MGRLDSSLSHLSQQLESEREQVGGQLRQLGDQQRNVADRVRTLGALVAQGEQAWRIAEVEYLLRIAVQRVLIQRDVETAQAALRSADARLQELADPHYAPVREQIATEVKALEAVTPVDTAGIAAELYALQRVLDKLPVAGVTYQPRQDSGLTTGDESQAEGDFEWRQLPARVWASLSRLVRVREHNRPIEPMLPPDRDFYLRENVKLQLAAAQVAVMDRDSAAYSGALSAVRDWFNSYFDPDSAGVAKAASKLKALAALDIDPDLPDVSGSLRRLREQMKSAAQQSARASVAKPAAGDRRPDTATSGVEDGAQ
jgi:uroporphyrin-3 C-methyltransferase